MVKIKSPEDIKRLAEEAKRVFIDYVNAFINHKKFLVALVNGPAVGISVTTLPLYDLVIASDKATFHTPFTSLGISAEGCSSLTFPLLMGHSKATEVLLLGRKLTAHEAFDRNLVTEVIPSISFRQETENRLKSIVQLPTESMGINKLLLRSVHQEALLERNRHEADVLAERWQSNECMDAVKKFFMDRK